MRTKRFFSTLVLLMGFLGCSLHAATNAWVGTSNSNWVNDASWSLGHAPLAGEDVVITNIGARSVILSAATPELASFMIATGTVVFTNWTTVLNASQVTIANGGRLTLPAAFTNGAMSNRIAVACTDMLVATGGVVTADGTGFAGGRAATSGGPTAGGGPGSSAWPYTAPSGGAGHGGVGGISGANFAGGIVYDSPTHPLAPGSGASGSQSCNGGSGGGAIWLQVANRLTLLGTLTANGSAGSVGSSRDGGGGSGGSVFITCATIAGTNGVIRANGGTTSTLAGGGGGGRIALHYDTAAQALAGKPQIVFQANPGLNAYAHIDRFRMADWGTLYFTDASGIFAVSTEIAGFSGHLVFPSPLGAFEADSLTLTNAYLGFDENPFAFRITNAVTIFPNAGLIGRYTTTLTCTELTDNGLIKLGSNSTVTVGGNLAMTNSEFTLRYGSSLAVSGAWDVEGAIAIASLQGVEAGVTGRIHFSSGAAFHTFGAATNGTSGAWGSLMQTADDLVLENDSWILVFSDSTNGGSPLFRCNRLLIDSTSGFNADGRGFAQDRGPGTSVITGTEATGGAGHGGRGGYTSYSFISGGIAYGNSQAPVHAGSGGGHTTSGAGGAGGGVIRIEASGLIVVNGILTASGNAGSSTSNRDGGGGAGGSIYLICDAFSGTGGLIRANGGAASGSYGGAGGGGRISLQYNPASQAALEKPSVRFEANAGTQTPVVRPWLMADWGTLCFPDAEHVFKLEETMTDFSGYVVIPEGPTTFAPHSLTISDSCLGFETNAFAYQITGAVFVAANAGLLGRSPQSFSCATLTNLGTIRFGTNTAMTVAGQAVLSNSFSLRSDSTLTIGGNLVLKGPASLLSIEGSEAFVGQDLVAQSGVVFSIFSKATNTVPRAWGARIRVNGDIALETGAWIHPWSENINGGSPLFQCHSLSVAENAGINADSKGFVQNRGPNPGISGNPSGGGGHGGKGGNSSSGRAGGAANDRSLFPLLPGSGGGNGTSGTGGTGGGTIRVEAQDALSLNGTFSANGGAGSAASAAGRDNGGGAGGTIFVIANAFSGGPQAVLSARGAAATTSSGGTIGAGGGGGGRIAIWTRATTDSVAAAESNTNRLTIAPSLAAYGGSTDFAGGTGWQSGSNGTLAFITFQTKGTLILVR